MSDDLPDETKAMHNALSDVLRAHPPELADAEAILVGYVMVTEWMDAEGDRWLSSTETPGMASWHRDGILHHRLNDWSDS